MGSIGADLSRKIHPRAVDDFDRLPDSLILLIFNIIGDVKHLGRCWVVSRRFHPLVPQVDNVVVRIDCVISDDDPSSTSSSSSSAADKSRHPISSFFRTFFSGLQTDARHRSSSTSQSSIRSSTPAGYVFISPPHMCCTFLDSTAQGGNGREVTTWDDTLRKSTLEYQHQAYNILTCNCHSFVANCLNRLKFQAGNWNVVSLAVLIFMKGRFVSRLAILQTYLPFVVVLGLGLVFGGGAFLTYLSIFICVLVGWFLLGTYCCKNLIHV
ncbi:hypothetical protein SASPL_143561 [Salvia splendens]|uniref:Protein RTE1-HOMOLOG n=1 Tax=Salvia splendens TaxID=180675 RepID=A0A8X8ZAY7_SALSN|nr:hypothetical protein SASPL_143561 [Salvia splendens]